MCKLVCINSFLDDNIYLFISISIRIDRIYIYIDVVSDEQRVSQVFPPQWWAQIPNNNVVNTIPCCGCSNHCCWFNHQFLFWNSIFGSLNFLCWSNRVRGSKQNACLKCYVCCLKCLLSTHFCMWCTSFGYIILYNYQFWWLKSTF